MIGTRVYPARGRLGYEFDPVSASAEKVAAICAHDGSAPLRAEQ